jgi:uncharacterized protein (DUF4415 family)
MRFGLSLTDQQSFIDRIEKVKSATLSWDFSMAQKSSSFVRSETTCVGSYQRDERAGMKEKNITIVSRDAPRRKGKTDWARLDAMTDEEIEAAVANDPDAAPLDIDWSKAVLIIPPKKKAISIRVDEDVLDYFKKEGAGYQRRMNAVLRSYMQQKRKKRA